MPDYCVVQCGGVRIVYRSYARVQIHPLYAGGFQAVYIVQQNGLRHSRDNGAIGIDQVAAENERVSGRTEGRAFGSDRCVQRADELLFSSRGGCHVHRSR